MASMSVTDAAMTSSPGPAVSGARSSSRSVRPGRASLGRSMDPTRPAAPVMRTTDTPGPFSDLAYRPGHGRVPGRLRTLFISLAVRRLGILMGFTRGSLTLPRMNAHRLVIIAAALTVAVAAALATALVTFSGQALPRAVRHDLAHATGTSLVMGGNVNASQAAQYTSLLPGKISAALDGTPFAFYRAYWSDPLGFVPGSRPVPPGGTGTTQIAEAATLQAITAHAVLVSGHWPGGPGPAAGPSRRPCRPPPPRCCTCGPATCCRCATGYPVTWSGSWSPACTGPGRCRMPYWGLNDVGLGGSSTCPVSPRTARWPCRPGRSPGR